MGELVSRVGSAECNLAGDRRWRRDFNTYSCNGYVIFNGLGISRHDVILNGGFQGTIDFGEGPVWSETPRRCLMNLGP